MSFPNHWVMGQLDWRLGEEEETDSHLSVFPAAHKKKTISVEISLLPYHATHGFITEMYKDIVFQIV
jgi:hypothetical protein